MFENQRLGNHERAWRIVVGHFGGFIIFRCRSFSAEPWWQDQVADVSQEILLKLQSSLLQYQHRPGIPFRAWLWTVVCHGCIDAVRKRDRQCGQLVNAVEDQLARSDPKLDAVALKFTITEALAAVHAEYTARPNNTDRNWEMFVLSLPPEFGGELLDPAAIAARLGIANVDTVSRTVRRMRERLKAKLAEFGEAVDLPPEGTAP